MSRKTKAVYFRLEEDLHASIVLSAELEKRDISNMIRLLLREGLAARLKKQRREEKNARDRMLPWEDAA